jgi:hypothetical protein
MPQFYRGNREAASLIDRAPQRVGSRLEKALRDRRSWKTRLFQREKARFLDGYIARLEGHEEDRRRGDAAGHVPGMLGGLREADIVQTIAALNRSGWSIGEAALVGEMGEMVRIVSRAGGEDPRGAEGPAAAAPEAR